MIKRVGAPKITQHRPSRSMSHRFFCSSEIHFQTPSKNRSFSDVFTPNKESDETVSANLEKELDKHIRNQGNSNPGISWYFNESSIKKVDHLDNITPIEIRDLKDEDSNILGKATQTTPNQPNVVNKNICLLCNNSSDALDFL
mmetsp:Transcript_36324/g.32592  ORF Transcript_36324/g.32592 Transcript_36324/m.32592 type:complete len:143 (+) Transcript_36324:81-509(+)